jgi:hypothetical protein
MVIFLPWSVATSSYARRCEMQTRYSSAVSCPLTRPWRASGGVGRGLRQRRGEEALDGVEWLGALARSAQDKGALVQRLGAGQFEGLGDELGLPAYRPPYRR